jgi:hypothetical protein
VFSKRTIKFKAGTLKPPLQDPIDINTRRIGNRSKSIQTGNSKEILRCRARDKTRRDAEYRPGTMAGKEMPI